MRGIAKNGILLANVASQKMEIPKFNIPSWY
jgi:hypothetical protein